MNRALKGVLWALGAYAGVRLAARVIRRRRQEAPPALVFERPPAPGVRHAPRVEHQIETYG